MIQLSIKQAIPASAKVQLLFAAVCLLALASLPWIAFFRSAIESPNVIAFLVIGAWSSLPAGLAVCLAVYVVRKVTFFVSEGELFRETQFLFWRSVKRITLERAYLAFHQQHRRRRILTPLTLFIRQGRRVTVLASKPYFSQVEALFALLKSNTPTKCHDLRNQGTFGGLSPFRN